MFQDKGEDDTAQTEKGEFLTEETETISVLGGSQRRLSKVLMAIY